MTDGSPPSDEETRITIIFERVRRAPVEAKKAFDRQSITLKVIESILATIITGLLSYWLGLTPW